MSSPADQTIVETTSPGEQIELGTVPEPSVNTNFFGWSVLPKHFQLLLLHAHIHAHLEQHRQLVHRVQLLDLGVDHRLGRADVLLADDSHLGGKG